MQNTKKMGREVAKEIEKFSGGNISFTFDETKCLEVVIKVNDDLKFMMRYEDYNVALKQILPDLEYGVSYTVDTVDGDTVSTTKIFETEEECEEFTKRLDNEGRKYTKFTNRL